LVGLFIHFADHRMTWWAILALSVATDLLFLPVGWWHHVRGLEISITMTFTNFVFDNDFHSTYRTYQGI